MSNATIDFKNETFDSKARKLIKDLEKGIKDLQKQNKFHSKIVENLKDDKDPEIKECVKMVKETMEETILNINALNKRLEKSKELAKFLDGDLILDLDQFAMLMIEVLGSQMVNYIELKNEHVRISKKWLKK